MLMVQLQMELVLSDGQTVEYTLDTATALSGKYEVQLDAGLVKDTAFAKTASKLVKQTVDFGRRCSSSIKSYHLLQYLQMLQLLYLIQL